MADCPNCEYHKNRAARWRAEAYKQAGHDVIELPWVDLTVAEIESIAKEHKEKDGGIKVWGAFACAIEAKLKEKNT